MTQPALVSRRDTGARYGKVIGITVQGSNGHQGRHVNPRRARASASLLQRDERNWKNTQPRRRCSLRVARFARAIASSSRKSLVRLESARARARDRARCVEFKFPFSAPTISLARFDTHNAYKIDTVDRSIRMTRRESFRRCMQLLTRVLLHGSPKLTKVARRTRRRPKTQRGESPDYR